LRLKYAINVRHGINPEAVKIPGQLEEYHDDGIRVNARNPHFPFWVKLVLDVLNSCEGRISEAADSLEVSTNQLVQFLDRKKDVWEEANEIRNRYELGPLKN
jgi:hypothetical protein